MTMPNNTTTSKSNSKEYGGEVKIINYISPIILGFLILNYIYFLIEIDKK
jgi:hypothetical protein